MRRHGPVIAHCTDSEVFPLNVLGADALLGYTCIVLQVRYLSNVEFECVGV